MIEKGMTANNIHKYTSTHTYTQTHQIKNKSDAMFDLLNVECCDSSLGEMFILFEEIQTSKIFTNVRFYLVTPLYYQNEQNFFVKIAQSI